ncbi:MAG: outer membrane beta-barrel protein [Chitinophagaceae bacterium]
MRKVSLGLVFLLLLSPAVFSQSISIKGTITDTAEKKNLTNAVISLLTQKDSILIKFTRSDFNGNFIFNKIDSGDYLLWVTYPKFADFTEAVRLKSSDNLDMGSIALTLKSTVLQEVVVRANRAINIKGDTTEFTADSFHVKPGATVEELLKTLPGLQVDSKGKITAQGKQVDKVLVDGEEFFGEDPTIATQNIGAKAVDKVQVFDTKTEADQLKGIGAAGNSNKTINIKLKDSAKKGYFGKLEAGSDFDKLLNGKLMFNKFKGNEKFSVYGTKSNISTGSLGWEDRNKMGIENNYEYDELSGFYYSFGDNDNEFNDWNLKGIPNAYTAGGLYSNKWNEEKNKLNLSYLYNRLGTTNNQTNLSQTLLEDTTFYNNSRSKTNGLTQQHAASGKYEWKIDSLASIKLTVAGTYKDKDLTSISSSEALNEDKDTVNANNRTNLSHSIKKQLDNQLQYKQLFKKKNRIMITTLRFGLSEDDQNAHLNSSTWFYKSGLRDSLDITDQQKINTTSSTSYGAKIAYSEPLSETWNLVTELNYNRNRTNSHRNTYERDANGKYTELNPIFSNNFDMDAYSNSGTVTARYQGKKLRGAIGAGVSAIRLNLNNADLNTKTKYNFTGFTPQAQLGYKFKAQTQLYFSYRGNTVQPTLNQLQPLRDNTDPLSIYLGNPNLKVGFNHNLNLSFNDFKVLKSRYLFMNVGMNLQENAITNLSVTDSFGKTTYLPVNVKGNKNYYSYAGWESGQGDKKINHFLSSQINGGHIMNYLNGSQNINTYINLELDYGIRYSVKDKYNFNLGPVIKRSISKSSLRPESNNNYWTYGARGEGWVSLPLKLELSSELDMNIQQKTTAFPNPVNITVWNAELSRKFFKDKTFELTFTAHDLLNQNIGFTRTINSNFISQQQYDKLSRYFLLTAKWTFNKMPGKN